MKKLLLTQKYTIIFAMFNSLFSIWNKQMKAGKCHFGNDILIEKWAFQQEKYKTVNKYLKNDQIHS